MVYTGSTINNDDQSDTFIDTGTEASSGVDTEVSSSGQPNPPVPDADAVRQAAQMHDDTSGQPMSAEAADAASQRSADYASDDTATDVIDYQSDYPETTPDDTAAADTRQQDVLGYKDDGEQNSGTSFAPENGSRPDGTVNNGYSTGAGP